MQTVVHHFRSRRLRALAAPGVAVVAGLALSGPGAAAPAPSSAASLSSAPAAGPQGIIMRDGGICDPSVTWAADRSRLCAPAGRLRGRPRRLTTRLRFIRSR